jgi:hypothetical protein
MNPFGSFARTKLKPKTMVALKVSFLKLQLSLSLHE